MSLSAILSFHPLPFERLDVQFFIWAVEDMVQMILSLAQG